MRTAPNPVLRWLLTRLTSRHAADATIGDILEDLDARRTAGHPPRSPRVWLHLRMVASLGAAATAAMPSAVRAFGLTMRDATRSLRRAPVPSLFMFLILAVAISAATVTFSVVDAVVLRPLPFDHGERIVTISRQLLDVPIGISVPQFDVLRTRVPGLESIGLLRSGSASAVMINGASENLSVGEATSDAFRVLRISPVLGRIWSPDDEAHRLDDVAVISDHLWRERFARDTSVIGRVVRLKAAGRSYEIIGVLPDQARSNGDERFATDIWVPYARQLAYEASAPNGSVSPLARLKPGVSIDEIRREINAAVAGVPSADPRITDPRLVVERWDTRLIGDARGWLLLLLGAVGLVLVIACVNVANVMLTQSAERAHDLAVRASFGASRRQLAASVLAESVFLSLAAGAAALLFSTWGIHAAKAALPARVHLFRESAIGLNGRVLVAGTIAALATGLLLGLVPAWQASRTSVVALLKEGGAGATGRSGWRSAFLVAEVGSIGVLLVVSTLFILSFVRVLTLDVGFDRSHLVAVPRLFDYHGSIADLKGRLSSLPGVTGVAAAGPTSLPFEMGSGFGGVWIDAVLTPTHPSNDATDVDADVYRATPDFFDVAGITFLRGSTWPAGAPPTPRPMVIDEVAARQLFGTQDPIGQLVHAHSLKDADFTVVGVVPYSHSLAPDQNSHPFVYYAMAPSDSPASAGFLVRTSRSPAVVAPLIQSVIAAVRPPGSGKPEVYVVDDAFRVLTEMRRFNAALMSMLGLFAVVIGAAGIYAVMSSVVAQQTKEIGVRVALGATAGDIRGDVLARAGRHLVVGLAIGLPVGWLVSRAFASQFFQTKPTDPLIYVIVAATLGAVAFFSAIVPARRASRVDPVVSLRAS